MRHPWHRMVATFFFLLSFAGPWLVSGAEAQKAPSSSSGQGSSDVNTTGAVRLLGAIAPGSRSPGSPGVALLKHTATGKVAAIPVGKEVFDIGILTFVSSKMVVVVDDKGTEYSVYSKLGAARVPGTTAPLQNAPIVNEPDRYAEDGFERVGNQVRVDSAYRDRMVTKELPTILMSAASEPVVEGGTIRGFRLFQFEPGSIFEKLGMQDGDIVESINGVPLNDVARTIQFLNGLKGENKVEVSIFRKGRPVNLDLSVQ